MNILQINEAPHLDNSIESYEVHSYTPYSNSFKENDEIRIPINQQDIYLFPSASSIYIEGRIEVYSKDAAGKLVKEECNLNNNPIPFLFHDIRYEINGVEIDRIRHVGITSTMKSYVSMNEGESKQAGLWGWNLNGTKFANGYFNVILQLNKLLGFAEDYNKIVLNCKHELVLTRCKSNAGAVILDDKKQVIVNIERIQWRVPHIRVSDRERLLLLKQLEKDKPIQISFRNWDTYEYPLLPKTKKHSWSIKTASQLEKPRYVIFGLQTKKTKDNNCSLFNHCNLTNVTLYLNSQTYPYDALKLDFNNNKYHILYEMYIKFRQSYYNAPTDPLLNIIDFKEKAPLFVIDCSRQNETLKTGPVDVRLEIESDSDFPDKTSAYCLIINDRIIEYKPLSSTVRKIT